MVVVAVPWQVRGGEAAAEHVTAGSRGCAGVLCRARTGSRKI